MKKDIDKKEKKRLGKWVLIVLAVIAIAGAVFTHFGGFSTGESADPAEFKKYASAVEEIKIPDGVSVVALGEASHGNREFQQLKLDVFKVMVENYGVRAFALEGDFGGCEAANRYIHGGYGTAEQAAADIGFDIYKTEEMAELIEYMRDFNKTAAEGDDIRFYGFDMQRGLKSYNFLLDECDKLNINTDEIKALVRNDDWASEYNYSQRKEAFESLKSTLLSNNASDFAVHLADVLIQNCDFFGQLEAGADSGSSNALRDLYMKDNVLWVAEQEKSRNHDRIFISGHNGHMERLASYDNMGSLLAEELGDAYYVIGTDYYRTSCNLPSQMTGKRGNHTFYSHDPLAKAAKKAGYDTCWLDFGMIPEDSSLKNYTSEYIYNGSLVEGFNLLMRLIPMANRVFDNPELSYDSMIYVADASPIEVQSN